MVNQSAERRPRDTVGILLLQFLEVAIGHLLALFCIVRFKRVCGLLHLWFLSDRIIPILLADEGGIVVDHHHAALAVRASAAGYGTQHVVRHIARRIGQSASRRMRRNYWSA